MLDISWLSTEARAIHDFFVSIFYLLASLLIVIGVLIDYFKMTTGGTPHFSQLAGRALVAAILLAAYPEISNTIAAAADAISDKLGGFNNVHQVLDKAGETLKNQSWSWTSVGDTLIWAVSYLAYFFLYVTVFFFDAAIIYCLVLLYIFSPLMIALYILPQTAGITSGLFRALFEVAAWKIVWSILATLLWSSALNNFGQTDANFITQLAFTLMLAFSILLTPVIVRQLISGTLASAASQVAGYGAIGLSAGVLSPAAMAGMAKTASQKTIMLPIRAGAASYSRAKTSASLIRSKLGPRKSQNKPPENNPS